MTAKVDQFPAINSNPVFSVAKDGVILYSNKAGEPLLHEWGVRVGEKVPQHIEIFVQRAISREGIEKIEVKMGERVYFVVFQPLPEQECVNIYTFGISDRKELEGKLRESDTQEKANLELANIIDAKAVQSLMNDLYRLAHIPMALLDLNDNILVSVGWQEICSKFHRVNPEACKHCLESDINLSTGVTPGEYKLYKCKNNMWNVVTPIIVEGQHIGNIFSGQFFFDNEPLDRELFRFQALKYGFNEEEYLAVLEKVPRLSREAVDTSMAFFMTFANMISQLSYSNIKLSQSLAERDAVVDALRESEKRERDRSDELAVLLDAVPISVYIAHDPQSLQITGNRLSYEWLRIPVGTNLSKSAPEGEKPEIFKLFKDGVEIPSEKMPSQMSAAGIEINDCELDIVSADGKVRHVLGNARPLRDEQGNLRGSISAFIDITERKKMEKALRLSNIYNRSLIEASLDPLITIGRNGKITDLNGATEQVTGYSRNDLIGTDFSDYFTEPEKALAGYQQVFMHGEIRDYPLEIQHKDGHITPVLYNASVYSDENDEVIGVFAAARDIAAVKKAEEKIQILANAVESSNDAIITKSLDGIIISWNNGAEKIYGYLSEEVLGKNISTLEPDNTKGEIKNLIEKIKQGERVQHYETLRMKKDGTIINVSVTLSPVFDASGKLVAISTIARDITENKKAEEAIRLSNIYNRSLIEASLDPLVTIGRNGKITDLNGATEQVTGYSRNDLIGTDFSDYFTEPEKALAGYQQVFMHGEIRDYPLEIQHKDGHITPVLYNASVYSDENGEVIGVFAAARDIAECKRVEGALLESESCLRLAQVSAGAGIWDWNMSTEKLEWSEELFRLFGLDPGKSDASFEVWRSVLHPDDRLIAERRIETAIINHIPLASEYRIVLPSGDVRWINALGNTTYGSEGKPQRISGICIDITERKKAEEALKKTHDNLEQLVEERTIELEKAYKSLKESEIGLAEAQRMAHIGNWEWDTAAGKVYWSEEMYRIFRCDSQKLAPPYNEFLNYVHPDDRDYVDSALKKAVKGKTHSIEYRIVLANGEERAVHMQSEVTFDPNNRPIRTKGIIQDITERKKAEEAMANIETARKKEIHHRIKNNLQVISSLLDLQADKFENPKVIEAFRESQNRVISMALIHEELYKGEGKDTLDFSTYIRELAENLLQTYSLSSKNICLCMDMEENIFLNMDTGVPLGIIVNELVSNSLKHAFPGKDRGKIRIKLRREKYGKHKKEDDKTTSFILTVSDNGIGIPENLNIEHIDSLGIQLINALVDQLNGELELKRNDGTEFTMKFTVTEKYNQAQVGLKSRENG
ncbi:PAS domain S-box protein [Methanosarcina sp. WWM596]|uniref:PAS domain S-box protein n=1 Tax=Methanosarcina sp. WWM596 TaxID=1434103 RepID=UPI0006157B01|nr:PAS domain S-box protein [Methanosarcina sp. WWM596]AKB17960.1 sensory transduction histidine kinase [Methanosarcina sp. WWM596]